MMVRTVCVFCGSQTGHASIYETTVRTLGQELAARRFGLVYGGGRIGLMGAIAESMRAAGSHVTGVIPDSLASREIAYQEATELIIVGTMHERKAMMAARADAFLILPGGYGTCDEMFEILTWSQLEIHRKPIGIFNIHHFFDPMFAWLDVMVREGFLKEKYRHRMSVLSSITEVLGWLELHLPSAASHAAS